MKLVAYLSFIGLDILVSSYMYLHILVFPVCILHRLSNTKSMNYTIDLVILSL